MNEPATGGTHTDTLDCHLPNKCINLSSMMVLELPLSMAMHLRMNLDNGWLGYSSQQHLLVETLPIWCYGCPDVQAYQHIQVQVDISE